jgi:2-haloacid dehalogenase
MIEIKTDRLSFIKKMVGKLKMLNKKKNPQALIFDVFGTVVDWRTSIKNGLKKLMPISLNENELESFAVEWRTGYTEFIMEFNSGKKNWKKIDDVHFSKLLEILKKKNYLKLFEDSQINEINLLWHKLDPWPDTVEGLNLLKNKFSIGTLSNGNFSLLLNMSKYSKLNWDFIFSGDIFKKYKTNPRVYKEACDYLGLNENEVALVAAHESDLLAAKKAGLQTFYIERQNEFTEFKKPKNISEFDITAKNFIDLNSKL